MTFTCYALRVVAGSFLASSRRPRPSDAYLDQKGARGMASDREVRMLECFRQWTGKGDCRLAGEYRAGVWEISRSTAAAHGRDALPRFRRYFRRGLGQHESEV